MFDVNFWILATVALASVLTVIVTGAMLYSVCEIVGERMSFWQRMRGK